MAGTRHFDTDDVLTKATQAFWRDGYEATSIQTLEAATGLGRGSLYNAFGDKAALFLAVLDHYAKTVGAAPLAHLANADVRAGLEAMLRAIAARMDTPGRPRGCLLTNSCLAPAGQTEVEARIATLMGGMQAALEAALRRGVETDQLASGADVVALARFYCAVVRGIGVSHKAGADLAALTSIVDVAMRAFPKP